MSTDFNQVTSEEERKKWWREKRIKYNISLVLSGMIAFVCYSLVVRYVIPPAPDVEITIFTILFQGMGYLIFMILANIFYSIGSFLEDIIKPKNTLLYRRRTFNTGLCFSCSLPFFTPIILLIYNL